MRLSNSFEIARDVEEVFDAFLDIERVATCMPGARLTKMVDDSTFEGEVKVKVGPLGVAYAGSATLQEIDREAKTMQLRARGRERSGAGNADALVKASLHAVDGGTRVDIDTDLSIRGKVAQFGRGAIGEVSGRLMQQFAGNVEEMLSGASGTPESPDEPERASELTSARAQADTDGTADSINAVSLLMPMLRRVFAALAPAALAAVAAFVGARLGSRRTR